MGARSLGRLTVPEKFPKRAYKLKTQEALGDGQKKYVEATAQTDGPTLQPRTSKVPHP
jgi:hypothetical protein